MSAFADALNAVRQVVLLHARVEAMDDRISALAGDVSGLTDASSALRDRVSRLEGIIEGVGMAASASRPRQPRLPKS